VSPTSTTTSGAARGSGPALSVDGLAVTLHRGDGEVPLVRESTFDVGRGELVTLVGESGSGKSVTARAVMGLLHRRRGLTVSGSVRLHGEELLGRPAAEVRALRGRELAMIFQEPMGSLDPVFTIEDQMREAVRRRERSSRRAERARLVELLGRVGIADPERCLRQYPHQLSGGMCQRVMIAMALAARPEVLIADEPTTALDLTIQAQILGLLEELRRETGAAVLLITHDMGVAAQVADRIAVMYAGRVVETGTPEEVFDAPAHPYTEGLLSCIPAMEGARERLLRALPGSVPDPSQLPTGCAFHPRCGWADDKCREQDPPLAPVDDRPVACWHAADRLHADLLEETR
jgi:oligopeptide/dipeptide ABC transporter ATP-binding protein